MVLAQRVAQLEEKLRLAGMLADNLSQVSNNLIVQQISGQLNGDAVNSLILHILQILHTRHLQVLRSVLVVLEARLNLTRHVDGSANGEITRAQTPVVAEERQLARTFEVLQGHDTKRFAVFGEARTDSRHDAAQDDIFAIGQCRYVGQFRTACVTEVVEHNLIFVQRMSGEIDAHEVALLVQALNVAPADIGLGNRRRGYLNTIVETAEERVLHLLLLLLIELTIAHQRVEEHLALGVLGKKLLTANAERVEATTQCQ